jgi:hypothetical protein
MGLDVYVGTLTRYHAGEWETIVQQAARERGEEVRIVRLGGDPPPVDQVEVRGAVDEWRVALGGELGQVLDWDESPERPYHTDKPGWEAYGALQLLAAQEERGEKKPPKRHPGEWDRDKVWKKASGAASPRYPHLYAPELWLPVELPAPVGAEDVVGNDVYIGSSQALLAELRELNERTLRGTDDDRARWLDGAPPEAPYEELARFGLAVFLDLTEKSVSDRLPMRLDY